MTRQKREGIYTRKPEFEVHDSHFKALGFSDIDLTYLFGKFLLLESMS
jgi:hypothetical protein